MEIETLKYIPKFSDESLKKAIRSEYSEVACKKDHLIHFVSGLPLAKRLGYPDHLLAGLPEEAIRPFAGVGNPFKIGPINPNEIILDIGCGAGLDLLIAWLNGMKKNPLYGIDITDAMIQKVRENASHIGARNVNIIKGNAENIPLPDASIDVVISNGVINLCPDKLRVYQEINRVLKPGGRFQIADVILKRPVPEASRDLVHLWTNCVAGGVPMEDYLEIIDEAGFAGVELMDFYDVFADARIAKSAAQFGAMGYNVKGYKSK